MTVKIGMAGFGFMGKMHFNVYAGHSDSEVTHICSKWEKTPDGSVSPTQGNVEGKSEDALDLSGVNLTEDFDEMLRGDIDAVDICLPTHLHSVFACKALEAGKHVFCEKPLGSNPEDADRIVESAEMSGCILQVGQCLRFWPEYMALKEIADNETYGPVHTAAFTRLSPCPTWSGPLRWWM